MGGRVVDREVSSGTQGSERCHSTFITASEQRSRPLLKWPRIWVSAMWQVIRVVAILLPLIESNWLWSMCMTISCLSFALSRLRLPLLSFRVRYLLAVRDDVRFLELWRRRRFSRFGKVGLKIHAGPNTSKMQEGLPGMNRKVSEGIEFHVNAI